MGKHKRTVAIIAAGGSGRRIGKRIPKQFLPLGERTILGLCLEPFEKSPLIDGIVLVVPRDYLRAAGSLVREAGFRKIARVVAGGDVRQDSVARGMAAVPPGTGLVVVHDGVRPFADAALIARVLRAARTYGAAAPGLPAVETVKRVDTGFATATLDRRRLWSIQTPQAFHYPLLKEALARARRDRFSGTDDASLVERMGVKVRVVRGSEGNTKITTPRDLGVAEKKVRAAARKTIPGPGGFRVGQGYDLHPLVRGRPLVLGGVRIPSSRGALGDSDADVLTHALIDALLGASALGDIGTHFPPGARRYRGIRSTVLLRRVVALFRETGFSIRNVDATVILEDPRIGKYRERMKEKLCPILKVPTSRLSIKATTGKGLGEIGRGEAVACQAVVLLDDPSAPGERC